LISTDAEHCFGFVQDMRYFFVLLIALLCSFGLTFSVLLSPPADSSVNVLSIGGGSVVQQQQDSSTVFGTFEVSTPRPMQAGFKDCLKAVDYLRFASPQPFITFTTSGVHLLRATEVAVLR
jgi:hypothetical protein